MIHPNLANKGNITIPIGEILMQIFKDMKTIEYDDFIGVYEMVKRNLVWVLDVTQDSKNSKNNTTCDIKLKYNLYTQDM